MRKEFKVLLIEDEPEYTRLAKRALANNSDLADFDLIVSRTFKEAIEAMSNSKIDMVLMDVISSDQNSVDIVEQFNQINPDIPIVVLRNPEEEISPVSVLQRDTTDLISNQNLSAEPLARVVKYAIEREYVFDKFNTAKEDIYNKFSSKSSSLYTCSFDKHWTMIDISKSIRHLTGFDAEDFIDNYLLDFNSIIHPEDKLFVRESIANQVYKNNMYQVEYRIIDKNGKIRWLIDSGSAKFADGNIEKLDGVLSEITRYKLGSTKVMQDKEQIEFDLNNVNEFVCNISHEISNISKLIKSSSCSLVSDIDSDSNTLKNNLLLADNYLSKLIRSIQGNLCQDDHSFESFEKFEMCEIEITKLLQEVVDLLVPRAAAKGLNLFGSMPSEKIYINAEENLLKQMFDNLICSLINLFDYNGGSITLYVNPVGEYVHIEMEFLTPLKSDRLITKLNGMAESLSDFENSDRLSSLEFIKEVLDKHNGRVEFKGDRINPCLSINLPVFQKQKI